jgi:hypothetical protein
MNALAVRSATGAVGVLASECEARQCSIWIGIPRIRVGIGVWVVPGWWRRVIRRHAKAEGDYRAAIAIAVAARIAVAITMIVARVRVVPSMPMPAVPVSTCWRC